MALSVRRWIAGALVLMVGACTPLRDLGWGPDPLTLADPIGMGTKARLTASVGEPAACYDWLSLQGVGYTPVKDRDDGEFCLVRNALTLSSRLATTVDPATGKARPETVRLSPARPMMTCPLAAALAVWRRQSVEPAARELLGAGVAQIDHLGVYACRRIYGGSDGRPSAHARAAAIDIAGFRLTNGKRITVARDWQCDGPEARFLRRVRDDACRVFATTLSPDYNTAHADHLHLEAGRWGLCS